MKKNILVVLLLCSSLGTAMFNSCGDENFWKNISGITINPIGDVAVGIGKTTTLTATVTPDNVSNKDITWSSNNMNIATIGVKTGVVTGVSTGTVTISATAANGSGITANKSVTVYSFGQGDGTQTNPYIITTAAQLDEIRNNCSAYYKLGNNIDLTAYLADGGAGHTKWGTAGWDPINKDDTTYFSGGLDGAGYKITGLWINRPSTNGIGLFSFFGGIVQNLGIEIAMDGIIGNENVGALAGFGMGNVTNCYISGAVKGNNHVGGIAGIFAIGSIANCFSTGSINTIAGDVGGIIGFFYVSGNISNCYSTCIINGSGGGIVGDCNAGSQKTIANCVALNPSVVSSYSSDGIGRIVGYFNDIVISNNWARNDMVVTATGTNKTLNKGSNTKDGADCVAIPTASWWTTAAPNGPGWDSSVWYFANGQLPILQWQR